jgi:hypothetical protein
MVNNRRLQSGLTTGTYMPDSQSQTFSVRETSATVPGLRNIPTQDSVPAEPRIVNSIRELQLLTQQARPDVSTKDQPLTVERNQEQKQETGDRRQEADISFETGHSVVGLENKQRSTEKFNPLEPIDQSQTTERTRTAVPDFSRDKLEATTTLAEAYAQANIMTFPVEAISAESDTDVQSKRDIVTSDIIEQVKRQLEDLINTIDKNVGQRTGRTSKEIKTNIGLSPGGFSRVESSLNRPDSAIGRLDDLKVFSPADLSVKAKSIRATQTNTDTFSISRFNNHF